MGKFTGKKILIVDDEPAIRECLRFEFEIEDAQVFEAENGNVALASIKQNKPELVISDIQMPECDGVALLKQTRAIDRHMPIVLFISGQSDLTTYEALNLGASGIFPKPFPVELLIERVEFLLKSFEKRVSEKPERLPCSFAVRLGAGTAESQTVNFGRGGMCIQLPTDIPAIGATVSFVVEPTGVDIPRLEGTGIVRWIRETQENSLLPAVGIEFQYLNQDSINLYVEYLKRQDPIVYIPKLMA